MHKLMHSEMHQVAPSRENMEDNSSTLERFKVSQPGQVWLVLLPLAGDGWAELCILEVRARREARNRRSQGECEPREVGGTEGWV